MKFIELFAGVGGFRYGLEACNRQQQADAKISRCGDSIGNQIIQSNEPTKRGNDFSCVWANEWDKYAAAVYRYHWNDGTMHEADIRTVDPDGLPEHDLICGGFPCQSFSIAGKRRGFSDTRGTLFFEIMRIARACRSKYLFLENVKGLLNHKGGATFQTIITTLDELGYDCEWQVLNSKAYVPQNRERIFIIANLRGEPRLQVFPIRETSQELAEWNTEATIARAFTAGGHSGGHHSGMTLIHTAYQDGIREYSDISPTASTPSGGGHLPMVAQALQTDGQLRTGTSWNTNIPQSQRSIRRLTPIECERLQAFPDNWTKYGLFDGKVKEISDTQRYKMMGNAVTTAVITDIKSSILRSK